MSDQLAVSDGCYLWSYGELNAVSNQVARALLDRQSEPGDVVGLLMEQGALCVAAILGSLKAGMVYSSLDSSISESQLRAIIEQTSSRILLVTERTRSLAMLIAPPGARIVEIGEIRADADDSNLQLSLPPDTHAYIFFTSGSTGTPKGVLDSHRNVLHNVMRYTNSLRICKEDRLSLLQAPSFSGSVSNVFGALLNGASLFPYEFVGNAGAIGDWIKREEITIYHSVPSLFQVAARSGLSFPSLRVVRLEGDQASRSDVDLFKRCCLPECKLVNGLGATECGLVRQYFVTHASEVPSGVVPVGYPVVDMDVQVVDKDRIPLPNGEVGEIAVRSQFLALGYWQDPEQTHRRFILDEVNGSFRTYLTGDLGRISDDGCLEILGRKSLQPSIRGRLVDVSSVESCLLQMSSLKEVAVHALPNVYGELRLVAYCVTEKGLLPPIPQIRAHLADSVPDFMIPSAYVVLDALPLSSHGKLDRQSLPPPDTKRPETGSPFEPPQSELECHFASLWEGILGVLPVGVHDNFFDMGGESLSATQLIGEMERELEQSISLATLVENPTIRRLAKFLEREGRLDDLSKTWGSIISLHEGSGKNPLFLFPGAGNNSIRLRRLAVALGLDRACYGYVFRARHDAPLDEITVEEIAADFITQVRRINPSGPYKLCGYSWGAILAFEVARQLAVSGSEIDFLGIIDEPAPIDPLLSARWIAFLGTMHKLNWRERLAYLRSVLMRRIAHEVSVDSSPPQPEQTTPERWLNSEASLVGNIAYRTTLRYRPAAYPGDLILYVVPNESWEDSARRVEPDIGWSRVVSGRVSVIRIDGPHDVLLDEPQVTKLASKMASCLV